MKDVNKIFESIHEVYESHDGGGIWLDDSQKLLIKNQLRQLILANKNHGVIHNVRRRFYSDDEIQEIEDAAAQGREDWLIQQHENSI